MFGFDVSRFGIVETDGDILVPHRDPEGVYGVKIRQAAGGKSSVPGSQFTTRLYDPYGWAPRPPTPVCVITEGESDCWAMDWALGPDTDVYGLPSGASCWKDHWLDDLEPYHTVWLCFDNDRAGKQALDKVTRKVGWAKARELRVPDLYTDARAAIEAGWVPAL